MDPKNSGKTKAQIAYIEKKNVKSSIFSR